MEPAKKTEIKKESQMSCVLKVDTQSTGWHKAMTEVLMSIKGVSYNIDAQTGMTYVSGSIDEKTLMKKLKKAGKHAQLIWVNSQNLNSGHQPHQARDIPAHPPLNFGHHPLNVGHQPQASWPIIQGNGYGYNYSQNYQYGMVNPYNDPHQGRYHFQQYPYTYPDPHTIYSTYPRVPGFNPFYDQDTQCSIM